MNSHISQSLLCVVAICLPLFLIGGSKVNTNLPSECSAPPNTCGCQTGNDDEKKGDGTEVEVSQNDGDSVDNGCIMVWLGFGRTTPWTGSLGCSLKIFADDDSPLGWERTTSAGVTPSDIVFCPRRLNV